MLWHSYYLSLILKYHFYLLAILWLFFFLPIEVSTGAFTAIEILLSVLIVVPEIEHTLEAAKVGSSSTLGLVSVQSFFSFWSCRFRGRRRCWSHICSFRLFNWLLGYLFFLLFNRWCDSFWWCDSCWFCFIKVQPLCCRINFRLPYIDFTLFCLRLLIGANSQHRLLFLVCGWLYGG